jgi:XRE family aerobic/anaerobic benzoate catabolism transcriptional regulator
MKAQAAETEAGSSAEVGRRLRAARAKAGLTRKQLAASSGTSERYLALLEAGSGNPSLSVLTVLAASLDLPPAELLPLSGERDPIVEQAVAAVRRLPADRLASLRASIAHPRSGSEKGRRVVLIGLRGAGKTSLGHALAERLGVPFLEVSKEVERAYGGEIGLLIELNGQSALRRYEREVWEELQQRHEAAVIAAPGGIVADGPLYDRVLATAHSIWLRARPEDHMERVMSQGDFRPMTSNRSAMADLKAILDARSGDYARADLVIDTSAQDFAGTADLVEARVKALFDGLH